MDFNKLMGKVIKGKGITLSKGIDLVEIDENTMWYDTGSYTLNKLIHPSGRGIPGGCLVEIYGPPGSGKSLLLQLLIKSAQDQGGTGVIVDPEGAFEPSFTKSIGLDLDNLSYVGPVREIAKDVVPILRDEAMIIAENVFKETRKTMGKEFPLVFGFDSLSALNVKKDFGKKDSNNPVADQGAKSKSLRQWIHRVLPLVEHTNYCWVFISHSTAIITQTGGGGTQATGGSGPKFNSHVRIELSKGFKDRPKLILGDGGVPVGEIFGVYIAKDRKAPPYKRGEIQFYFREAGGLYLDYYSGYMGLLKRRGVVTENGGWFKYTDSEGEGHSYRATEIDKLVKEFPEVLAV